MSSKTLLQRVLIEGAQGNSSGSKEHVSLQLKGDQWSPAALERAGSTLKALNRMAKRPPVHIVFEDIGYTVNSGKDERRVLKNVSGEFRSGELACILGPSGAGKSTLLNILTGYICNNVSGRIRVNGLDRDMNIFKKLSSYIMQDDLLQPWLTVKESMNIVANLKLGPDLGRAEKELIVEEILQTLGLWEHRDTFTQKLSGGQSKRLSVAMELVNNPPVIFLDEPTTGLDVVAVRQLVVLLRLLSRQGRTIICTIHQPSASLFSLFDQVYIISQGMCCYQGAAPMLVPFMEEAGYVCPTNHNPADFVLETLTGNEEASTQMSDLCMNGKLIRKQNIHIANKRKPVLHSDESVQRIFVKHVENEQTQNMEFATTFLTQFSILVKRTVTQTSRDMLWLWIIIMHHALSAVLMGSIFFQVGNKGSIPITTVKFCLCVQVFLMYTYAMIPILLYPKELRIIRREHFNRWYSLKAYYAARTCSTLPLTIFCSTLFLVITYLMTGQPLEITRFLLFSFCGYLMTLCSEGLGLLIGSTLSTTNGAIFGPAVVSPLLAISCYGLGFGDKIEQVMRILMKLSFVRYCFSGQSLALYLNRAPLDCDQDICLYTNTHLFLRDLGMINDNYAVQCLGIIVYLVLFRLGMYFALKYRLTSEFRHKLAILTKKLLRSESKRGA